MYDGPHIHFRKARIPSDFQSFGHVNFTSQLLAVNPGLQAHRPVTGSHNPYPLQLLEHFPEAAFAAERATAELEPTSLLISENETAALNPPAQRPTHPSIASVANQLVRPLTTLHTSFPMHLLGHNGASIIYFSESRPAKPMSQ